MKLVTTTVVRESIIGEQISGRLFVMDLDKRQVVAEKTIPDPIYPRGNDNPRGGSRGGRGIATDGERIYMANYDTISIYNNQLDLTGSLSHPLFVDIHEICYHNGNLWLSCTGVDLALCINQSGDMLDQWCIHDRPSLIEMLGISSEPKIDKGFDYRYQYCSELDRTHLNNVSVWEEDVYFNLGRYIRAGKVYFAIVRYNGYKDEIVWEYESEDECPSHNGQPITPNLFAINDSARKSLLLIDRNTGAIKQVISINGLWNRGLFYHENAKELFVGSAPATIHRIDLASGRELEKIQLSEDPCEAIHGLILLSDNV